MNHKIIIIITLLILIDHVYGHSCWWIAQPHLRCLNWPETPCQADTQYTDRIKIALDDSGGGVDIDPGVYRSGDPSTTTWMCIPLTVVSGL